jgi:hypothetical protein
MSRPLSTAAKNSIYAQETILAWLIILEIDHADLGSPIRVVNNDVDIVSNGDTYSAFPFQVTLPDEREDRPPVVRLVIGNVDLQIVTAIRSITSAPTVDLSVVTSNDYDTLEVGPLSFSLKDISYDSLVVEGSLVYEPILDEPYPSNRFIPSSFPGLF